MFTYNPLFKVCAALTIAASASNAMAQGTLTLTPESSCVNDPGHTLVVDIDVSGLSNPVVGGQFFLQYDSSTLTLDSVAAGAAPFTTLIFSNTSTPGLIDLAVGVPGGGPGTAAPSTMATLTFHASHDICATAPGLVAFRSHTPPTRLTDNLGDAVNPTLADMASIRIDSTPPVITCPPNQTIHTSGTSTDVSTIFGPGWTIDGNASVVANGSDLSILLDAHDSSHTSAVRFAPQSLLLFPALTTLSADFNMQCGRFGCASPHFKVRIDWDNNGFESAGDKTLRILWGSTPLYNDCPGLGIWTNTGNLMASPDARFDTSDFPGGVALDTYSHALSLIGAKRVLRISAVAEELCSLLSCTTNCLTTTGGRTLLFDNFNINGNIQRFNMATATDNCDPAPLISAVRSDGLPLTDPYPTGHTTITWTATDTCGNTASCNQLITVTGPCGSADFNCDGDIGTDSDIEAFFACLAGNCPPPPCTSTADFNGDGDIGTDSDIEAFFRVLAGGSC